MKLAKKIALVTGASRGIGRAIAKLLAQQGAYVIGTATTVDGVEKINNYFDNIACKGNGALLDVSNATQIESVTSNILNQYQQLDILVNNAGINQDSLLMRMKDADWDKVIDINLTALFKLSKIVITQMIKQRQGRIINIGSVIGSCGNIGQTNYAAAKAGIIGFSKALALEVANRGITVNVVSPGFIETDMTKKLAASFQEKILNQIPAKRWGTVEDISQVVAFLAADEANYITGQNLHVNGGMYMN